MIVTHTYKKEEKYWTIRLNNSVLEDAYRKTNLHNRV